MGRKPDPARREELLNAAATYVLDHGLARLSLRPLASALGVSPRVILYHFGSKEQLVLETVKTAGAAMAFRTTGSVAKTARDAWDERTDTERLPVLRLFFEVWGLALQEPDRPAYGPFLEAVLDQELLHREELFRQAGLTETDARIRATLLVSAMRGLLLDRVTTGDVERTDAALDLLLKLLVPSDVTDGRLPDA